MTRKGTANVDKKHKCLTCYDLRQELKRKNDIIFKLRKKIAVNCQKTKD